MEFSKLQFKIINSYVFVFIVPPFSIIALLSWNLLLFNITLPYSYLKNAAPPLSVAELLEKLQFNTLINFSTELIYNAPPS